MPQTARSKPEWPLTLLRGFGLLLSALVGFVLIGTWGCVFSVLDPRTPQSGQSLVAALPYASLAVGLLGIGAC